MQRIAFVTGANKGIGFATARALAREGFHVIVGARDSQQGQQAVERLRAEGHAAELQELDVADPASLAAAAEAIARRHDRLDVLVNNAGINPEYPAGLFSPSELDLPLFERVLRTNALAAHELARRLLPLLRRAPAARIVNLSSTVASLAEQLRPGSTYYGVTTLAYNASKTLLNAITVQWAKALAGDGIKVNAICPGWVRTDMGGQGAPRTAEQAAAVILRYATLDADGPTGGFFDEAGTIPW